MQMAVGIVVDQRGRDDRPPDNRCGPRRGNRAKLFQPHSVVKRMPSVNLQWKLAFTRMCTARRGNLRRKRG